MRLNIKMKYREHQLFSQLKTYKEFKVDTEVWEPRYTGQLKSGHLEFYKKKNDPNKWLNIIRDRKTLNIDRVKYFNHDPEIGDEFPFRDPSEGPAYLQYYNDGNIQSAIWIPYRVNAPSQIDFYKDGTIASESWHIRDGVTRVISYHENGSVKEDLSYHTGDDEDFIVNNSLFYNKNY